MRRIWPTILLAFASVVMAADPQDDEIPPLRPPIEAIQPGFWEANGTQMAIAILASLFVIGVVVLLARRRKPSTPLPPEEEARAALAEIRRHKPEDLSAISRVTRRGLAGVLGLPEHEMTTTEFCTAIETAAARLEPCNAALPPAESGSPPVLTVRTRSFLERCDTRKFGPVTPPDSWDAAGEALDLIDTAVRCSRSAAQPLHQG